MLQFILISISIIISSLFINIKHPLAIGMTLLMQTLIICLITGSIIKTFWFSYTLFLIFLGGILILFIYVTALASNRIFSFSIKLIIVYLSLLIITSIIFISLDLRIIKSFLINIEIESNINIKNYIEENVLSLNKLYNFPTNLLTITIINYLFLTLIIIVNITKTFKGPLRSIN